MAKNDINSSQFEILNQNNIEYSRKGGYFVTTKKAIVYLIITIALSTVVGFVVYQYGPNKNREQIISEQEDIEELIDESIRSMPIQEIRLPKNVYPLHYKLTLKPELENLTFSGEVSIIIQTHENTKFIVLNVDQLEMHNISITQIQHHEERKRRSAKQNTSQESGNLANGEADNEYYPMGTTLQHELGNITQSKEVSNKKPDERPKLTMNETVQSVPPIVVESAIEDDIEIIPNLNKHVDEEVPVLDTITILSTQRNKGNSQYSIHISKPLRPQKMYMLTIRFNGNISEGLQGLHQSSYINKQGTKKNIVMSHFQPVFARRVFPCFDEPSMKAAFDINIIHKESMMSLSNMPLRKKIHL